MDAPLKYFRAPAIIATAAITFWLVVPVWASPLLDGPSGKIALLEPTKPLYNREDTVFIRFRAENDGDVKLVYRALVVILDPTGDVIYDSGKGLEITLAPAESRIVNFRWTIPDSVEWGVYLITGILQDWGDREIVYDEITVDADITFEVERKPVLRVSPSSFGWIYDSLQTGDIREDIEVTNRGGGTLEWEVTGPDWVELSPTAGTGAGTILVQVNSSAVANSITAGSITTSSGGLERYATVVGDITIVWNLGEATIPAEVRVIGLLDGKITLLKVIDSVYRQGDEVAVEFRVENDGDVALEYRAAITIRDEDGKRVRSNDIKIAVKPGSVETVTFRWPMPLSAPTGTNTVTGSLLLWNDSGVLFDAKAGSQGDVFRVRLGPKMSVSPASQDFGSIVQGNTPDTLFEVETQFETLEWEVTDWPDWVELVSPTSKASGPGTIRVKLQDVVSAGRHSGTITVTYDGKTETVSLSVNVQLAPPPTAIPTATPTETPVPPASPTPTSVPPTPPPTSVQPTPTPTLAPVQPTPTPTPTLAPVQPPPKPALEPSLTPTAALPTNTPPPTMTPSPQPASPTPLPIVPSPERIAAAMAVPPAETPSLLATKSPEPTAVTQTAPSGGPCGGNFGDGAATAGVANVLFLLAPMAILVGYNRRKRRDIS